MAWNLGLVRGTSRGLAREADRKYGDHVRQMNTETSQLDALINQLRYNKEAKYRQERDAENTRRWNITNTRDAERHGAYMEGVEYDKSRRPFRERAEEADVEWREGRTEALKKESDYLYGKPGVPGVSLLPESWQKYLPESIRGKPGYRDLQRDEAELRLGAVRRNEKWLTSPEGQAYTKRQRELTEDKLESDIAVNTARAWALKNPQSTSTAKPKTLTYTDVRNIGAKLPSARTMLKDHGTEWNPFNWGHKYLPWTAPMGEKSLTSQLHSSGVEAGQRIMRQTPGGIPIHEVEQHIGALWEGVLSQEIDGRILPDALFNDVPENLQSNRMNDAYRVFRAGVREGLGLPIEDTGDADTTGLFESFMDTESGTDEIGSPGRNRWTEPTTPQDPLKGYTQGLAEQYGVTPKENAPATGRTFLNDLDDLGRGAWRTLRGSTPRRSGQSPYHRYYSGE